MEFVNGTCFVAGVGMIVQPERCDFGRKWTSDMREGMEIDAIYRANEEQHNWREDEGQYRMSSDWADEEILKGHLNGSGSPRFEALMGVVSLYESWLAG